MKRTHRLLFLIVLALAGLPADGPGQQQKTLLYVSPTGDDTWSGRLPAANQNQTDGPFETLDKCRRTIRALKKEGQLVPPGVTVYLRGGVYALGETFRLTGEDSGALDAPVTWCSYPGEIARFRGGREISGFRPITDRGVLDRIDPAFRDHVLQTDLKGQGIREYGHITPRGGPGLELFFQSRRMVVARWPNEGWVHIADVPQSGTHLFNEGLAREKRYDGVPVGRHYGRITYSGSRPSRWANSSETYLHGYWTWDWSDSFQKVKAIDTLRHEITLDEPHHNYGYTKNQRFYFLNILEEIDTPGEWFLDRTNGILYFWPPEPLTDSNTLVSLLETPLIALDSCSNIFIRGIQCEYSRGAGITVTGGSHDTIGACTLRNLGNTAVIVEGGTDNGVVGCDIEDVAMGGIIIRGGDRNTLTPAHNSAVNNHIHDYSTWLRTGQVALYIDGVGNRLANNLIHHAPHEAIYLRGNDHVIEYNEVHHVTLETGDAGALHTGRDWTWRGNIIRYNYFHDLQGPGLHGVMGVYLDDWASGFVVFGNIFIRAGRATLIGGGRDNLVENNIYVECTPAIHIDARGLGWASYYFDGTFPELFTHLQEMKYTQPPYSTRYPELLTLPGDEPAIPKHNRIIRNVSYGGRWLDIYDYTAFDFSVVTMKDNVIADPIICRRRKKDEKGWDPYYLNIDTKEGYDIYSAGDVQIMGEFKQNMFLDRDPGFVDLLKHDVRLRDDSPAFLLGFRQIPIGKIGLRRDRYRSSLPE